MIDIKRTKTTLKMALVYVLFANVHENELIHFYIPADEVSEKEHFNLKQASDPICSENHKQWFNKLHKWDEYIRDGPQVGNITYTYCISFMNGMKCDD